MTDLEGAGAALVDPITIPDVRELLAKRAGGPYTKPAWDAYFGRSAHPPYQSREEMLASPDFPLVRNKRMASIGPWDLAAHHEDLLAREKLMFNVMKTMADHELDAIVHKSVEHQPTLIEDASAPGFVGMRGATHLNTFVTYVPAMSVPIGFTADSLPVGMTFLGRPFSDGAISRSRLLLRAGNTPPQAARPGPVGHAPYATGPAAIKYRGGVEYPPEAEVTPWRRARLP